MTPPRLLVTVVAIALSLTPCASGIDPVSVSGRAVILTPEQAPRLMKQCSRPVPDPIAGFWMPSPRDVALVEKQLRAFVKKSGLPHPASAYCRQYVGVISSGRKIIYINALLASDAEEAEMKWAKEPAMACGGGSDFWGAEFDLLKRNFQHFITNVDI